MAKEILVDKNYKDYDYISRYANVPYYFNTLDQKYIYGTSYQLSEDNTYLVHIVRRNDTFDSLSLTYYNTPLYFWVIMDYNHIQDPFDFPEVGSEIKVPTLSSIAFKVN